MRAVLDANVIISGVLSPEGAPARLLVAWREGAFELIVSPKLLAELDRAFAYPKLRSRVGSDQAQSLLDWLGHLASLVEDVDEAPVRSVDPADDYLLALAGSGDALLVSGDKH
ncbi:MAG TPA: putative toxin-antitoxin system toxin component, PIN family, partial [Solirubrobacteraceae bacterium]